MKIGDRIKLLDMPNDPAPLPRGATGTINYGPVRVGDGDQYGVRWDPPHLNRSLSIIVPPDRVQVLVQPAPWGVEQYDAAGKLVETMSAKDAASQIEQDQGVALDRCWTESAALAELHRWQVIKSASYCWVPVEKPDEPMRPDHRDY